MKVHGTVVDGEMGLKKQSRMCFLVQQAAGSTSLKGVQSDVWGSFQRQRGQSARDGENLNGYSVSHRVRGLDERRKMEENRATNVMAKPHEKKRHSTSHSHSHYQRQLAMDE